MKWTKVLETMELPQGVKYALVHFIGMWRQLEERVKEIEQEIAVQAKKDGAIEEIYRSVPGVGPTSARILANELEDTTQFSNERQLFSYVGLTPSEHSSGEHIRQGHITRQGKPILRKILVQVAWAAVRFDPELGAVFTQLKKRIGVKKAIIGMARRLIGKIRACFRTGELYRVQRIQDSQVLKEELPKLRNAI